MRRPRDGIGAGAIRIAWVVLVSCFWSTYAEGDLPHHSTVYRCCTNRTVSISTWRGNNEPWFSFDESTGKYGGHLMNILDLIVAETGLNVKIKLSRHMRGVGHPPSWFADIHDGYADMTWGLSSNEMQNAYVNTSIFYTAPAVSSNWAVAVRKTQVDRGLFVWVQPFDTDLWCAIRNAMYAYVRIIYVCTYTIVHVRSSYIHI